MKKIIIFVLAITILAVNIFAFDITEHTSTAELDECGATVEAYRFVYEKRGLEFVVSIPKLVYETETVQKINQKIVDNLIEESDNFSAIFNEREEETLFCEASYSSVIDLKGIVVIIIRYKVGICYSDGVAKNYTVYYYSPETDSEISADEYLSLYGTSREKLSARFSEKNDTLKFYDDWTHEIVGIPPEDIYFAVFYSDGTESVCANGYNAAETNIPMLFGKKIEFAPQTGTDVFAYVAVAVVALAAATVWEKRRRRA